MYNTEWQNVNTQITPDNYAIDVTFANIFNGCYNILLQLNNNILNETEIKNFIASQVPYYNFYNIPNNSVIDILYNTFIKYRLFQNQVAYLQNPLLSQSQFLNNILKINYAADKGTEFYVALASFYATYILLLEYNATNYRLGIPNEFNKAIGDYFSSIFQLINLSTNAFQDTMSTYLQNAFDSNDYSNFLYNTFGMSILALPYYLQNVNGNLQLSATYVNNSATIIYSTTIPNSPYFQIPTYIPENLAYKTVYRTLIAQLGNNIFDYYFGILNLVAFYSSTNVQSFTQYPDLLATYKLLQNNYVVTVYDLTLTLSGLQIMYAYILALTKSLYSSIFNYNFSLTYVTSATNIFNTVINKYLYYNNKVPTLILEGQDYISIVNIAVNSLPSNLIATIDQNTTYSLFSLLFYLRAIGINQSDFNNFIGFVSVALELFLLFVQIPERLLNVNNLVSQLDIRLFDFANINNYYSETAIFSFTNPIYVDSKMITNASFHYYDNLNLSNTYSYSFCTNLSSYMYESQYILFNSCTSCQFYVCSYDTGPESLTLLASSNISYTIAPIPFSFTNNIEIYSKYNYTANKILDDSLNISNTYSYTTCSNFSSYLFRTDNIVFSSCTECQVFVGKYNTGATDIFYSSSNVIYKRSSIPYSFTNSIEIYSRYNYALNKLINNYLNVSNTYSYTTIINLSSYLCSNEYIIFNSCTLDQLYLPLTNYTPQSITLYSGTNIIYTQVA